jgi:hypothetical protein
MGDFKLSLAENSLNVQHKMMELCLNYYHNIFSVFNKQFAIVLRLKSAIDNYKECAFIVY